jgi:hypothetical protein
MTKNGRGCIMGRYLYPGFLRNEQEYTEAERFWQSLWDRVMRLSGKATEWNSPWLQTAFRDGTPFRDGDPIFSAICQSRRLGVRIVQNEPGEEGGYCDFNVTEWDPDCQGISVLVISCVLTDQTESRASDLLYSWAEKGEVCLRREQEKLSPGSWNSLGFGAPYVYVAVPA